MTNFQNSTELYNALIKQKKTPYKEYLLQNGLTTDSENFSRLNLIDIKLKKVVNKNGKKLKTPCYTTYSNVSWNEHKIPYTIWNEREVKLHNQWLKDNKHEVYGYTWSSKCDTHLTLLNNHFSDREGYAVIDVDSMEELWGLYKRGFPIMTTPFTLSTNKRLPHFYIKTCSPLRQRIGTNEGGREIDIITTAVFEDYTCDMYGDTFNQERTFVDTLLGWVGFDFDEEGGDTNCFLAQQRDQRIELCKQKKLPAQVWKNNSGGNSKYIIEMNTRRFDPHWELIPIEDLKVLLSHLKPSDYYLKKHWYKLGRSIVNCVGKNSNPTDYLQLIVNFFDNCDSPKYDKDTWEQENMNMFREFINEDRTNGFYVGQMSGSEWLYEELYKVNREVWVELAFTKQRIIDSKKFRRLKRSEAIKVFNDRVAYIGGVDMYVEFCPIKQTFIFHKKQQLKDRYEELCYTLMKVVVNEDGEQETKPLFKEFIPMWIGCCEKKKCMGGVCFKPTPMRSHITEFNLFTKFDADLSTDYDEDINCMSKEQLESELDFMLQHLRYLAGDDQPQQSFDFCLKYFAHLLKCPASLPRVSILWISVPRVGKNQWLNFIQNIMGEKYYYSSATATDMLGDFNDCLRGKLLLNLNEFKEGKQYLEALKELITEKTLNTREKHKNSIRVDNFGRIIITSNNGKCLHIEYRDGRFVAFTCNPITTSQEFRDKDYMGTLAKQITDLYIQKCFLRYCREFVEVDKDYNFELNMVKTKLYKSLQNRGIPYTLRFIRYWYESSVKEDNDGKLLGELTLTKLYTLFKQFITNEGETLTVSKTNFGNDLEQYCASGDNITSLAYIQNNPNKVIDLKTIKDGKKQKYYVLQPNKVKVFFEKEGIDTACIDWVDSSEDEEDDDEEDDE